MHETLKSALKERVRARDLRRAQAQLACFLQEYNDERPHAALGNATPAQCYGRSEREFPARLPAVEYGDGVQKRRVQQHGAIVWHNNEIFLSEVLAGEDVALEWIDEERLEVRFMNLVLGVYNAREGKMRYADGRERRRIQRNGGGRLTTRQKV
jgi:hypothetical protein